MSILQKLFTEPIINTQISLFNQYLGSYLCRQVLKWIGWHGKSFSRPPIPGKPSCEAGASICLFPLFEGTSLLCLVLLRLFCFSAWGFKGAANVWPHSQKPMEEGRETKACGRARGWEIIMFSSQEREKSRLHRTKNRANLYYKIL